ncbi:hypothetical protein BAE44_0004002 [Dichanthelium oligosanthes]|uniref:Uncharacterized protein n=1 Tax=Dichanthelium oligosanthes TaxID=888268 RepID=A0A1E5WCL1_9POAL|nr:hypothetical protein BAE44_0004002 [Dichanthelium oligosanthes]
MDGLYKFHNERPYHVSASRSSRPTARSNCQQRIEENHVRSDERTPSYESVALAGVGTGTLQTLILSPVELIKIRLQLEVAGHKHQRPGDHHGPVDMARDIL